MKDIVIRLVDAPNFTVGNRLGSVGYLVTFQVGNVDSFLYPDEAERLGDALLKAAASARAKSKTRREAAASARAKSKKKRGALNGSVRR